MNIIKLHLDHFDFFCPVTGIQLLGDGQQDQSPALLGIWNQEVIDEPEIYHEPLKERWEQWLEKQEDHLAPESGVDDFLAAIPEDNWLAFQLQTGGGLMPETVILVIDMNYCAPTEGENNTEEDKEPDNPEETALLPKEIDIDPRIRHVIEKGYLEGNPFERSVQLPAFIQLFENIRTLSPKKFEVVLDALKVLVKKQHGPDHSVGLAYVKFLTEGIKSQAVTHKEYSELLNKFLNIRRDVFDGETYLKELMDEAN